MSRNNINEKKQTVINYVKKYGIRNPAVIKRRTGVKATLSVIRRWVSNIEAVQVHRGRQKKEWVGFFEDGENYLWKIDLLDFSANSKRYPFMLIVIDAFSRYIFGYALPNKRVSTVFEAFMKVYENNKSDKPHTKAYNDYKMPLRVISDNGSEFKGPFKAFFEKNRIRHQTPQKDRDHELTSIVDVAGKTIRRRIELVTEQTGKPWYKVYKAIIKEYNKTPHSKTKESPYDVYFGKYEPRDDPPKQIEHKIKVGDSVRYRVKRGVFSNRGIKFSRSIHTVKKKVGNKWLISDKETQYRPHDLLVITGDRVVRPDNNDNGERHRSNQVARRVRRDLRELDSDIIANEAPRERSSRVRRKPRRYRE